MTIINVTPDSFFEASRTENTELIAQKVDIAIRQGATILDIGGYSSRPGAKDVSPEEELRRVSLAVEVVRGFSSEVAISIDTFRSTVAEAILNKFGEVIINDISASELDPRMIDLVADAQVPYIAMHMKGTPQNMNQLTCYKNIEQEVKTYFEQKLELFASKGIKNVILDPGFGFAKTTEQNYQLLHALDKLAPKSAPILVGVSRKSMIYKPLEIDASQALIGTTAINWEALKKGASILRVHDTEAAVQTIKLFNYYETVNSSK